MRNAGVNVGAFDIPPGLYMHNVLFYYSASSLHKAAELATMIVNVPQTGMGVGGVGGREREGGGTVTM